MAARQIKKATKKSVPAARNKPARTAVGKPKAVAAAHKTPAQRAATKTKAATSASKPASMIGPLPPIVTLKHLAEWAGYNHGVSKKQATDMLAGFVTDIGRALKKGSKIRIPNLGILQVRIRPARPARKGRNPATGEEIRIKASKASKKVAFRVAKALKEAI
jgi:DNA-binding protein HU-beta